MANSHSVVQKRKLEHRMSPRAQRAVLPAKTGDNVISVIQEALQSATLPKGTAVGLARLQYLKDNVWTKYADPLPGSVFVNAAGRKAAAMKKWQLAEHHNAKTNNRLVDHPPVAFKTKKVAGRYTMRFTSSDVINIARGVITSVLGVRPPHSDMLHGMFTKGASTRVKRDGMTIAKKFEGRPHATAQASLFWSVLAFANPGWGRLNPEGFKPVEVDGSVMFTVPKNSDIDRVACKEPEVNSYLQRCYGIFIRKRLKKHGIDLLDQSRNQYLSKVALERGLATVDLSAASDTITRELVKLLLPPEWFECLDAIRCKEVSVPNSSFRHRMEMFSSMGNGFTFELQSLIFWALTRAISRLLAVKGTISVFGDDIICPLDTAKILQRVFAFLGFKVNKKKSCTSGLYRESCGAHWFAGWDVKPFFVRERPKTVSDLIQVANQLMAWLSTDENQDDIPLSLIGLWGYLATLIDPSLYGGQSFERVDSLVTGHAPRKALKRKLEQVDAPQFGAYLQWHHSTLQRCEPAAGRVFEAVSPSRGYREVGWVVRPNRAWYDRDVVWRTSSVILYGLACR